LVGGLDGHVCAWDILTGKKRWSSQEQHNIDAVALSTDGKYALAGELGGRLHLYNAATGERFRAWASHTSRILALAMLPDGKRAISAGGLHGSAKARGRGPEWVLDDCTGRLWDLETGKMLQVFRGHTAPVLSLAVSAKGDRLVTMSGSDTADTPDHSIRLWDLENNKLLRTIHIKEGYLLSKIALSPD